jgi:hypothetical protein
MTRDELAVAFDRYGGDIRRWPAAPASEAEALVARDPEAAKMAARAAELDGILVEAVKPLPIDAALLGRILGGLDNGHPASGFRPTPLLAAWAGAAMIAFLSAGYLAGVLLPASEGEDTLAGLMFDGAWVSDSETADAGGVL